MSNILIMPLRAVSCLSDSRARGSRFAVQSGYKLSFLLLLIHKAVVSYWEKFVPLLLVNCVGGLSLHRNSVVR